MREKIERLCNDPLFQLNLVIWLAQPKPEGFPIKPIFYQSGFSIHSISPPLALPPDIRIITTESSLDLQDGAKPELILIDNNRTKLILIECKKSSFGISSTTSKQARTLLLLAGPIVSEVLGLGKRSSAKGILCYLTKSDQLQSLENTLLALTQELQKLKLEPGDYSGLGISLSEQALSLEYSERVKDLLGLNAKSPIEIIRIDKDTDPRPLYFIPYDPNAQSNEEQSFSRRVLYERVLGYVLSKIGPAIIPSNITFTTDEILSSVTFGIYEIWDDNEAKKHVRRLIKDFMNSILKEEHQSFIKYESEKGWIFQFNDQNTYEEILMQISKFKPETMNLSKSMQLDLFDK